MPPAYVPDAGDIVWINFDPQAGHEQAGHRPARCAEPRCLQRKDKSHALLSYDHADQKLSLRGAHCRCDPERCPGGPNQEPRLAQEASQAKRSRISCGIGRGPRQNPCAHRLALVFSHRGNLWADHPPIYLSAPYPCGSSAARVRGFSCFHGTRITDQLVTRRCAAILRCSTRHESRITSHASFTVNCEL